MGRYVLWIAGVGLWALFTFWYTNTGGPLTEAEVEDYLARYAERDGDISADRLRAFLASDTGNAFIMVNLLDLADTPPTVAGAEPGESAASLLDRYMTYMWPALIARACHPIYAGRAVAPALDLVGVSGAEHWETGALMRYRSRRDMMEIVSNPEFAGRHDFKLAALEKTIAFPVESVFTFADPRLLLGLLGFS
ncbi:MAG: hypothetical protein AAGG11_11900, partial [Pseudomonadota bacterium]